MACDVVCRAQRYRSMVGALVDDGVGLVLGVVREVWLAAWCITVFGSSCSYISKYGWHLGVPRCLARLARISRSMVGILAAHGAQLVLPVYL